MNKQDSSRQDLLATIERRFQFIVVLALFMPFVWVNTLKIIPKMVSSDMPFTGMLISYTFLLYFGFELLRKKISKETLDWIAALLLVFSYSLIVVIGFSAGSDTELSGWKSILLGLSLIVNIFLPLIIISLVLIDPVKYFVKWFKNKNFI